MPCNLNQRDLAVHVKRGVRDAGGTPMEFNTIAVSDGVSMGTVGHARLARLARGDRRLDRARRTRAPLRRARPARRLRQDEPRRRDGGRPPRHPGRRLLHGLDRARASTGSARSRSATSTRGSARTRPGRSAPTTCTSSSRLACPGAGRLRRPVHGQHDVDDPRLPRTVAVRHERDPGDAPRQGGGRLRGRPARRAARPRQRHAPLVRDEGVVRERRRLGRRDGRLDERACSTSSRSRATSGSSSRSTTSSAISARTPIVADMKPWGRWHANDMYRAGGVALVARELKKAGLLHEDARTVDGRTLGEIADAAVETEGQTVVVPIETPAEATRRRRRPLRQPRAGRLRREARRPRPNAPPRPGARVRLRGGHLRGRQGGQDRRRRRRRDPLRGPARRPRHARDAARHRRDRRRGALGVGRARSPTGASRARPTGSWSATSHPRPRRAARSRRCAKATSSSSTSSAARAERRALRRRDRRAPARTGSSPSRATGAACSRTTRRSSRRPRTGR